MLSLTEDLRLRRSCSLWARLGGSPKLAVLRFQLNMLDSVSGSQFVHVMFDSIVAAHIVSEDLGKAMVHMNTTPRKTASDMHVAKRISLTGAVHWNFLDTQVSLAPTHVSWLAGW